MAVEIPNCCENVTRNRQNGGIGNSPMVALGRRAKRKLYVQASFAENGYSKQRPRPREPSCRAERGGTENCPPTPQQRVSTHCLLVFSFPPHFVWFGPACSRFRIQPGLAMQLGEETMLSVRSMIQRFRENKPTSRQEREQRGKQVLDESISEILWSFAKVQMYKQYKMSSKKMDR